MPDRYTAGSDAPASPLPPSQRPFRHLCSEADYRDSLSDEDFWAHVFHQDIPEGWDEGPSLLDEEDMALMSNVANPCPECGVVGACSYDAEGRALIHVTPKDDDA